MSDILTASQAAPVRIQLKRAKGYRMPANTLKVDRSTRWGIRSMQRRSAFALVAADSKIVDSLLGVIFLLIPAIGIILIIVGIPWSIYGLINSV